jgi:hypothetical protein
MKWDKKTLESKGCLTDRKGVGCGMVIGVKHVFTAALLGQVE